MRRTLATVASLLGALAVAGPALAAISPPTPNSPGAEGILDIYWLIFAITGAVFVLVEVALVYFVVRYRRAGRPVDEEGPQVHGNTRLELIWTSVPALLLAFIVGYTLYKLPEIAGPARATTGGEAPLEIRVEGRQFHFEYYYPGGQVTYDTLIIPAERLVELEISAPAWDVVHSWWVPALAGKRDATPGRPTRLSFRAKQTGEFDGRCTEFCGLQHNAMLASALVVPADEWEAELARFEGRRLGEMTWEAACAKCHNLEGPQSIGPTLRGNPVLGDREALADVVTTGPGAMPPVGRGWSDAQIAALFEYLRPFAEAEEGE